MGLNHVAGVAGSGNYWTDFLEALIEYAGRRNLLNKKIPGSKGHTLLDQAVIYGDLDAVKFLLENGASKLWSDTRDLFEQFARIVRADVDARRNYGTEINAKSVAKKIRGLLVANGISNVISASKLDGML